MTVLRTAVFLLFATCSVWPAFAGPCSGAEAQLVRVSRELTLAATDMAEGRLRPIALSHPDCPEVLLAKARIEEARGNANQAVDLYIRYTDLEPNDSRGFAYFGRFFLEQRDYMKADALSGAAVDKNPSDPAALALRGVTQHGTDAELVEFPPEGTSFAIPTMDAREWPNPLTSCPGYSPPVGLPISLQMGRQIKLQSYSLRDLTKDRAVEACAFDAATYENPDLVAERHARETLKIYGAIVLIPRHALIPGHHYRVEVKTLRHTVNWSFAIAAEHQKYASER